MIIDEIMDTIRLRKNILIIGNNEKKNKEIYNKILNLLEKDDKKLEEYVINRLSDSEEKKKFISFFEKNSDYPYLTFLQTKENFPKEYDKFNTKSYIEKEFSMNKEQAKAFLKYDCYYSVTEDYNFFLNVGNLNDRS